MKFLKFFAALILVLLSLVVLGQLLPRPTAPASGRSIELPSGLHINAYEIGEGPTIILTHGLPGSAQDWPELADALAARGFHVVFYDRIGYGHSARRAPNMPHTMQVNAQELDVLIEAMGLKTPALLGWSFGGGTVLETQAARRPDIPFIVLLAPVGPALKVNTGGDTSLAGASVIMRTPIIGKIGIKVMNAMRFKDDPISQRWKKNLRTMLLMPGTLYTMATEVNQMDPASLDPSAINTPALIIHGRLDTMVPYNVGEDLAEIMPNATLMTLERAGHMLPMAYPDIIADAVKAFSDQHKE